MRDEYVFRGEREPFAPDPKDQRAREQAKREAEKLVTREPVAEDEALTHDAEVERRLEDYQVGGLDAFGASAARPTWDDNPSNDEHPDSQVSDDHSSVQQEPI